MAIVSFDTGAAALGGALGTIAMTAFWYALRANGAMRLDWAQLLGTLVQPAGPRAFAAGLGWHAAAGLLYGPVYAWILTSNFITPSVGSGLALGALHAAVALMWMVPVTRWHPALRHHALATAWRGRDLGLYALGYVLFGAVFGLSYQTAATWDMTTVRVAVALAVVALGLGLVGLATHRPEPRMRAGAGMAFASAEPNTRERRAALDAAYAAGRLTESEYAEAIAELEQE